MLPASTVGAGVPPALARQLDQRRMVDNVQEISASLPRRKRRGPPVSRSALIGTGSVLLFFAMWQLAPELGLVNGRFTSQPSAVAFALIDVLRSDNFLHHASISLQEFIAGFALSLAIGIPLGILMGLSRLARDLLDPPLMALYIAPNLILLPIIIVWLGIGMSSKVVIVFLGAVFPILINTMTGVREADPNLIRVARAFGGSRIDVFRRVQLPSTVPSILLGIRLAVGRGVLGVVVAELFASQAGIGHQIMTYGQAMRIDRLLVYVFAVSLFGYLLTIAVRSLEDRFQAWRPQQ
jgi:sulfonate transport system permease protein